MSPLTLQSAAILVPERSDDYGKYLHNDLPVHLPDLPVKQWHLPMECQKSSQRSDYLQQTSDITGIDWYMTIC